tara:strand:+ start:2540 stop:4144 length:1605 start_codon:yes stop_codon:yes gene_type:complete
VPSKSLLSSFPQKGSDFVRHAPCPDCGSRDNLAIYTNHTYCFGCHNYKFTDEQKQNLQIKNKKGDMLKGNFDRLTKRKIDEHTCKFFNYQIGHHNKSPVQIANYYNKKYEVVAQHIRYPNKDFRWVGNFNDITLFGQQNWRDGGKKLVITEGEIDAMSISLVQQNKYPVVSVPSGASSAKKFIVKELEWLQKFEEVILCFDNDEAGLKASVECAEVLPIGKAKIAKLQGKDANELLVAGKANKIIDAIFEAKTYTPQGIVTGDQTFDLLINDEEEPSIEYHWNGLNEKLKGIRKNEIVLLCAGSGTGKSQVCREIAYDLIQKKHKVGYIALEESVKRSIRGLVSIGINLPIHLPEVKKLTDDTELLKVWQDIKDRVVFYDHWGSTDSQDLMNRIRYMVHALGCEYIILDHISIVISGLHEGDERRLLDNTMTELRKLVEELKIGMFVVSHLKRPEGKLGHEEGVQTSLSHLRGSHSLAQLSDAVIGFERNQQDSEANNLMTVRVLKNRFSGETGVATLLRYEKDTGRLLENNIA